MQITISDILFLLFTCSCITSLITEAIKKMVPDKSSYSTNVIVFIIALVVGVSCTFLYGKYMGYPITTDFMVSAILLGIGSSVCSMVGYDKVVQTINQILKGKK